MTTTITKIEVEDILEIWEKHFHRLSHQNRKEFKSNKDAKFLTKYSKFQIERAITLGNAKFLADIKDYLRSNEIQKAPAVRVQSSYRVQTVKREVRIASPAAKNYYLCRLWQIHPLDQICACGKDE